VQSASGFVGVASGWFVLSALIPPAGPARLSGSLAASALQGGSRARLAIQAMAAVYLLDADHSIQPGFWVEANLQAAWIKGSTEAPILLQAGASRATSPLTSCMVRRVGTRLANRPSCRATPGGATAQRSIPCIPNPPSARSAQIACSAFPPALGSGWGAHLLREVEEPVLAERCGEVAEGLHPSIRWHGKGRHHLRSAARNQESHARGYGAVRHRALR
jgi:hypothetical protein